LEELMATQPKPKPKPTPEPPEPKPEEDDAAVIEEPSADSLERLHERLDALFTSQTALIDRVEKLEERVAAPPVGIGRRP
jgi:hypothetical protein